MSLRILFADDSVTAQNMGKKILTEAGYEVIAVSNGAAAVKKIAEQKPDIIILDVYMPGYTGLEVCEKVRASIATVKTPVLLTVGKMEPYKPEDARRVRADGVIIKPFEASDLLAIIKKFEERINANAPPPPPPPRVEEPMEEMPVTPEPAAQDNKPNRYMQPMVEVPDHMASTSAFSDLLGGDPVHAMTSVAPPPTAEPEPPPRPIEETELPVSWRPEVDPLPIMMTSSTPPAPPAAVVAPPAPPEPPAVPIVAAPEPEPVAVPDPEPPISVSAVEDPEPSHAEELATPLPIPPGPVLGRPKQIPVYQDPDAGNHAAAAAPESGPLGDIDVPRDLPPPEPVQEAVPQASAMATAPPEPPIAPAVLAAIPQAAPAPEPVAPAPSHGISAVPVMSSAPRREVSDVDFEARVAAAMAAYGNQTVPPAVMAPRAEAAPQPADAGAAVAVAPPAIATPSFEYRPPVTAPEPARKPAVAPEPVVAKAEPVAAPPQVVAEPAPAAKVEPPKIEMAPAEAEPAPAAPAPVQEEPAPASVTHAAVVAKLEETLPTAAAAVAQAAGGDHDSIADAVNRVMERMKGDLVDEIVRELKKK